MTDRLTRLLEIAGDTDKVELKICHNATVSCLKAYNDDPTAARKRDLDAARAGLAEAIDRMWPIYHPEAERFPNVLAVVAYLKSQGFKIAKSKIYKDRKDHQIRVQPDGSVLKKDADAYAKTLKLLGDPLKGLEEAQRKKLELETLKLEKQTQILTHELKVKEGLFVPRDEADLARAAALSVIEANVRNLHLTCAGDWIGIVSGDPASTAPLIDAMGQQLDDLFNRLSQAGEFQLTP
jgi:hypothetical protein